MIQKRLLLVLLKPGASACPLVDLCIYLYGRPCIYLNVMVFPPCMDLSVDPSIDLCTYLLSYLPTYLFVYLYMQRERETLTPSLGAKLTRSSMTQIQLLLESVSPCLAWQFQAAQQFHSKAKASWRSFVNLASKVLLFVGLVVAS